ncbi:T9SS type A sorting domain-containing protein [Daejeonella sp.]|uniref:T9SS type A sorting domain-containing protein n=1 Tax=Daejeonella sp. TaxID=2805397 RepID=UPI003983268E
MRNFYLGLLAIFITLGGITMPGHSEVFAGTSSVSNDTSKIIKATISTKITDTRLNRPAFLKNGVIVNFVPFKPGTEKLFSGSPTSRISKQGDNDKVLNNVKVYPNPVSDQLNLSYSINKDSNVTIKIMDVLGNEVTTLLTERLSAGDQANSFDIASRLTSGFYFIRVSVAGEIITKRISVL